MAWSSKRLFSFATKCVYFGLRLESELGKRKSRTILVLANYNGPLDPNNIHEGVNYPDHILNGNAFPASVVRRTFDYAQQRANELGSEVRIVMEACVKEEYPQYFDDEVGDEGLFAVATVEPSKSESDHERLSVLPVAPCSWCSSPATHKFVKSGVDETTIIQHGCDEHIELIRSRWV
jgi:hypothetical protein